MIWKGTQNYLRKHFIKIIDNNETKYKKITN